MGITYSRFPPAAKDRIRKLMFINRKQVGFSMARSDSFFIRANLNVGHAATFAQTAIDLGAYVDALGKSVLRIHNIACTFSDGTGTSNLVTTAAAAQFQLTTQSQTDTVMASNRSVISSGKINVNGTGGLATAVSHDFDNLPQLWTNGYLVAVDQIFLGGEASAGFAGNVYCSIILECTVETMTQAAAMALALSQQ